MLKHYNWKGVNEQGKDISGFIISSSSDEVRSLLIQRNVRLRDMKRGRVSYLEYKKHRLTNKEITLFSRQLGTLLSAGLPIINSLQLVANQSSKAELRSLVYLLQSQIESGHTFTQALSAYPKHFDQVYMSLIRSGEKSGNLADTLLKLAEHREKLQILREQIKRASQYPLVMLMTIFAVSYIMLTMVIPEFEQLFRGMGAELPWLTKKVLLFSKLIRSHSLTILLFVCGSAYLLRILYQRSDRIKLKMSRYLLIIPVFGPIVTKHSLARFSRTLATNYRSGLPILENISLSAMTTGNLYFQQAIGKAHQNILLGAPIYMALKDEHVFPELLVQMVMIGEQSGKLDDMLEKLASIYDEEASNSINRLSTLLEPMLILILGIIIGGLVIAMYLPIFNLTSLLG